MSRLESIDPPTPDQAPTGLARRSLFAGAAAVGAAGVGLWVTRHATSPDTPDSTTLAKDQTSGPTGDGYQETQHVLRYYQTARI
mgnify:CR=1 FL=1